MAKDEPPKSFSFNLLQLDEVKWFSMVFCGAFTFICTVVEHRRRVCVLLSALADELIKK
jgi:hypothetical protein